MGVPVAWFIILGLDGLITFRRPKMQFCGAAFWSVVAGSNEVAGMTDELTPIYYAHHISVGRCHHELAVTVDDDYAAQCSRCKESLPCSDCGWASFCILLWGDCKKKVDEARVGQVSPEHGKP